MKQKQTYDQRYKEKEVRMVNCTMNSEILKATIKYLRKYNV
jgi:hypothetical protein